MKKKLKKLEEEVEEVGTKLWNYRKKQQMEILSLNQQGDSPYHSIKQQSLQLIWYIYFQIEVNSSRKWRLYFKSDILHFYDYDYKLKKI